MNRRKMLPGFLLLAVAACAPQDPAPEPAAPAAVEPPAVEPAASAPGESATAAPEPLALRFVTPNLGPAAGGNDVTIDGRGFAEYPRVAFGGEPAWVRSVTPTEIRVTVPAPAEPVVGGTRTVDVTVTNPPQGAEAPVSQTLTRSYSYVDGSGSQVAEEAPIPPPPAPAPLPGPSPEPAAGAPGEEAPQPPSLVARFSYDTVTDAEDCPPPNTSVRFTDRSTGGVTEWRWDFGDGSTAQEQHVEHCYSVPGMRSVTLIVSNGEESATTSEIVTAGME